MSASGLPETLLILAVLFSLLLVLVITRRLVTAFLCAAGIIPVLLGMAASHRAVSLEQVIIPFLVGAVALMLGFVAAPARPRSNSNPNRDEDGIAWKRVAPSLAAIAILGTVIHFYLTGFSILDSDVEVQRFTDGSGLMGFPSRMYQFGLPLSAAASLAQAKSEGISPWAHKLTGLIFGAMLMGALVSGFKSGLLSVLITSILLAVAAGFTISQKNVVRIMTAAMISVLFAFGVGTMYESYRPLGTVASLQNRILQGSAAGPEVVLAARVGGLFGSSIIKNDLSYFAAKYFRIGSGDDSFAFQERVSSTLTQTPLRRDAFLVPITTTAVADTEYDFGLWFGAIALVVLGYALQRAEVAATHVTTNPYRFLGFATILLGGYSYVIHGGLIYAILNWSVVYALFAVICALTMKRRTENRRFVAASSWRMGASASNTLPGHGGSER